MEEIESKFFNKHILVTGGTGFVGSHLVKKLVSLGARVVVTYLEENNQSYFISEGLNTKTIREHLDVRDYQSLFSLISRFEIDYIFHLAAQPIVSVAFKDPYTCLESNIMGTINVLESVRRLGSVKAVVVASSDKAYGFLDNGKKYTEDDSLKGEHPYDVSKSCVDLIAQSYWKNYSVPVVISRFGNIYGEGDLNFSRIIPIIMKTIVTHKTLELRSNGEQIRDYLYISDVIDGYLRMAARVDDVKGEAFNFGSTDTYSVLELIRLTETILNIKINYTILNTAKNELSYQSLSDDKAKKILRWKRRYSYSDVVAQILAWYQNIR